MARPTGRPIRDELIAAGQELAKNRGVVDFSYADVAQLVGIRSASIHHHFAKKEDLVAAMVRAYREAFTADLHALSERSSNTERLAGYRDLFKRVAVDGSLCLCGSAAAEWSSIGDGAREEVAIFFAEQRRWLGETVTAGMASGEFSDTLDPDAEALVILSALEGALLLARAGVVADPVDSVFARTLLHLSASS